MRKAVGVGGFVLGVGVPSHVFQTAKDVLNWIESMDRSENN